MHCVRCEYTGGGGYYPSPDGDVCESCAEKDPVFQRLSIINLLFAVPYDHLVDPVRETIDRNIERFGFSLEELKAEAAKIDQEYDDHCRTDQEKREGPCRSCGTITSKNVFDEDMFECDDCCFRHEPRFIIND